MNESDIFLEWQYCPNCGAFSECLSECAMCGEPLDNALDCTCEKCRLEAIDNEVLKAEAREER